MAIFITSNTEDRPIVPGTEALHNDAVEATPGIATSLFFHFHRMTLYCGFVLYALTSVDTSEPGEFLYTPGSLDRLKRSRRRRDASRPPAFDVVCGNTGIRLEIYLTVLASRIWDGTFTIFRSEQWVTEGGAGLQIRQLNKHSGNEFDGITTTASSSSSAPL